MITLEQFTWHQLQDFPINSWLLMTMDNHLKYKFHTMVRYTWQMLKCHQLNNQACLMSSRHLMWSRECKAALIALRILIHAVRQVQKTALAPRFGQQTSSQLVQRNPSWSNRFTYWRLSTRIDSKMSSSRLIGHCASNWLETIAL